MKLPKEKIGFIEENDEIEFNAIQAEELNKRNLNSWLAGFNDCLCKIEEQEYLGEKSILKTLPK